MPSRPLGHQRGLNSESSSASEFLATSYSSYSSQDSTRGDPLPAEFLQKKATISVLDPQNLAAHLPKTDVDSHSKLHHTPGQHFIASAGSNIQEPYPLQQYHQNQQVLYALNTLPKARYSQGYSSRPVQPPAPRVFSDSLCEADYTGSDIYSRAENDDDLEYGTAQKHPYYNQWKQYYQAMALYQALIAQKRGASVRNSMCPKKVPSRRVSSPSATLATSRRTSVASFFNSHPSIPYSDSGLVQNSRRDTLKSNRSSLAPLRSDDTQRVPAYRALSLDIAAPVETTENHEKLVDLDDKPRQGGLMTTSTELVFHDLSALIIEPLETRQISDYDAFLHGDDDTCSLMPESLDVVPETPKMSCSLLQLSDSEILQDIEVYSLPPESPRNSIVVSFDPPKTLDNLNRQSSIVSNSSYDSLQSEKGFFVTKTPSHAATNVSTKMCKHSSSSGPTFVPPLPGPPPPIFSNTPQETSQPLMPYMPQNFLQRHSMLSLRGESNHMCTAAVSQQLFLPQMQLVRPYLIYQTQVGLPGGVAGGMGPTQNVCAFSSEPVINQRIDEFVLLRHVIASGNKTIEYKLKWMKMLLTAANYKLYSYINLKGIGVASDQVMANKYLFITAFVTHMQKLVKELDSNRDLRKDKTFAEVCYIQGCLYMNDYVENYGQDFGYSRDEAEAERFFKLCIQLNPSYFKAYYKLGEVYEYHQTEEKFDLALEQYKESARLGYNKAIYKIALIFLYVPKVRLIKYYKYLKELASIDMESTDVQLEGPDRDELELVVGLAAFQLGKIYEGIYPGDLIEDSEFVQQSISLAKVDYGHSLSYYNRAAKLHCLDAQVRLGRIYEFGELNRKPNASKSILWYIKATTSPLKFKRHPEAMLGVSRWFLKGSDGASKHIPYPNPENAVMWCERACKEFKYREAYYQMGLLVEGDFVDGDAYEWFAEASQLGHPEAQARIMSKYSYPSP